MSTPRKAATAKPVPAPVLDTEFDESSLFDLEDDVLEDEMMDVKIGATIVDGDYKATLVDIKPVVTHFTRNEVQVVSGLKVTNEVKKTGKVYNFIWQLADGRQLIDPRFTREADDNARKFQSINIALGNIATQLGKTSLTMRELLAEKPTLTVWVSRVGRNRNVDYLKPIAKQTAVGTPGSVGASKPAPF